MNIYLIGCEYAGKTTLAGEIMEWADQHMGGTRHFHDHFTIPSSELSPEAAESYRHAHPQLKEMTQRYVLSYHISPEMYAGHRDANLMGHAIEEAVYAPLYYGYGGKDSQAPFRSPEGQRTQMARAMEERMLERAPGTVLALLKAEPEVIRQRMLDNPNTAEGEPTRGVVQDEDVEHVLQQFEEEFEWSMIGNKIVLDTTAATVAETVAEFLEKLEPYLSESDLRRRVHSVTAHAKNRRNSWGGTDGRAPNTSTSATARTAGQIGRECRAADGRTVGDPVKALRLSEEALKHFSRGRSSVEVTEYLDRLATWMGEVNTQNHDGVTLTPAIVRFLASAEDLESGIRELERLRQETREGRFDADNELQRELEYKRFASEAGRQPNWPQGEAEQRIAFDRLTVLASTNNHQACELPEQEVIEARRAAFEAKGLLDFLREFRSHTDRPITVLGNERFGRLFVVEPLEPFLRGHFDVLYERVPSHGSMRLTVPHYLDRFQRNGFAPEFMKYLSTHMPHVVLVDVCSPRATENYTKIARGIRDLVNWFMVFNHIRAQGDRSRYVSDSSLPSHQVAELEKWWEFEVVARRISQWIEPGPTYGISHWAPDLRKEVLMGELVIPSKPAVFGNIPQVITANPAIYRTKGDDLPELMRITQPYYFNDPEKRHKEDIVPGFGEHGFETRVWGFTTDEYVAAVQRQIGIELESMVG